MWKYLPFFTPLMNLIEGIIDSCRETVIPVVGSVVYCDMYCGYADHSGVYVGNNRIVHLNGNGLIEIVSPKRFIANTTAINIYVSCKDDYVTGERYIADRATKMLGKTRKYNVIIDNCHQFTAGCINGDFENSCSFMWMLKEEVKRHLSTNTWKHWDSDFY
jgi:hypothetical protein